MLEGIAIGFVSGIGVMAGIAYYGVRQMVKHPEIVAKQIGKRMAASMRKDREAQPPKAEMIP